MKRMLAPVLLCVSLSAHAMKPEQQAVAAQASQAGAPYDLSLTLPAVIAQESSLCQDKHQRDPYSFGCGQLTLRTAQMFEPTVTEAQLMADDALNIRIAAQYLNYCQERTSSWSLMLRCYHGWGAPHWREYVKAVRARFMCFKRIRRSHE